MFLSNIFLKIIRVVISKQRGRVMDKVLSKIIEKVIANMSDRFRKEIKDFVLELEQKAKQTKDNPWDDIAVLLLKIALGID